MIIEIINDNIKVDIKHDESLYDLIKRLHKNDYKKYLAVKVNQKLKELTYNKLCENDKIEFIDITNTDGHRIFVRTLCLIFIKACKDIYHDSDIVIEHSLNKGLYCELRNKHSIHQKDILNIYNRMQKIIDDEMPINTTILSVNDAINIFSNQKMEDKIELLNQQHENNYVRVYELDGYYDIFYGYLAPNTNVINKFDIKMFYPGIILNFPTKESNYELPEYIEQRKLSKVFRETGDWGEIMNVGNVAALNNKIMGKTIDDMIRVNEALHEKKIAYIADEITKDKNIKIVLIAGPSSSGKTTFAQRLSIQLRVNGKSTYALSLDDYFVDRQLTPKDENGEFDFETIDALDLELFNEHLLSLIDCETVNIPVYNFKTGKREYTREPVTLTNDHIIIIEGIHGLNEKLTSHIPQRNKFKIYISALTQLNIDNHNRIATSDLRLVRRLVRDNKFRNNSAERTMSLWDKVISGTEKYIFPYQEDSDAVFNSALVYELGVLKKYAEPLLEEITEGSIYYPERQRLLKFLSYFKSIDDEKAIPNTSILKEFIGGSCFL